MGASTTMEKMYRDPTMQMPYHATFAKTYREHQLSPLLQKKVSEFMENIHNQNARWQTLDEFLAYVQGRRKFAMSEKRFKKLKFKLTKYCEYGSFNPGELVPRRPPKDTEEDKEAFKAKLAKEEEKKISIVLLGTLDHNSGLRLLRAEHNLLEMICSQAQSKTQEPVTYVGIAVMNSWRRVFSDRQLLEVFEKSCENNKEPLQLSETTMMYNQEVTCLDNLQVAGDKMLKFTEAKPHTGADAIKDMERDSVYGWIVSVQATSRTQAKQLCDEKLYAIGWAPKGPGN